MTHKIGQVRANVGMLALGLLAGLLMGVTLAPWRGAEARRFVAGAIQRLPALWSWSGRLTEELAEDLSS